MTIRKAQGFDQLGTILNQIQHNIRQTPDENEDQKYPEKIKQTKKGLEFMALKLDVANKHLELAVQKQITPAEDNLLKVIEMQTIGARNLKNQISTKASLRISEISAKLGYKEKDKIWKLLKSLHSKGIITREKTTEKDIEIIGLDCKCFGQVLCDKQHQVEKIRHLTLAVDNSKERCG